MSRNTTLEMLRNPKPYPQGNDEPTRPGSRQPYPSASQPAQRQPSQPRPGRQPPPSASQPRSQPPAYSPVDRSAPQSPQYAAPPSASQPRPSQGNPQKKKPRVAVSAGAPKPYQPLRQPSHTAPPTRYGPPSASQPRDGFPQRTPSQTPTPRDYTPSTTPRSTTPRSTTPRSPTPTQHQPPSAFTAQPPSPHHSNNNLRYDHDTSYAQPSPVYKNPPPVDDRRSRKSSGRSQPGSDLDSDPSSKRTLPVTEKKNGEEDYGDFSDELPIPKKSTSKHRLAPQQRPKKENYRKLYGSQSCGGRRKLFAILAIVFIVLLILALILGLTLSNRGVDYSGSFAMYVGDRQCDMVCVDPAENGYSRRAVLMIALDGFRPEFMNKTWEDTIPNIHRLAECGSVATNMEPSYPSTTYPNLYTLVTGLYPGVHGVIADYMNKDGVAGTFDPRDHPKSAILHSPSWYNGKPIWQTAKEQGVITGSHSWIGNNVNQQSLGGIMVDPNPDYYVQRDPDISFLARIQSALNWFTSKRNKAQFVNIYMEEPGDTIRKHGVLSNQVKGALAEVDDAIGLFMENLVRDTATSCFDIVIVSTAGHLDVSCSNTTYFVQILPNTLHYDTTTNGMNSMAFFKPTSDSPTDSDTPEELVAKLGCGNNRPFEAYTRDTVPPEYHFFNPDRDNSTVVIMNDWHTYAGSQQTFDSDDCEGARGGYSTTNPELKGVLIGFGPSFKKKYTRREGFTNIEVYNLISELIGVTPEENNGTHGVLNDLLASPEVDLMEVENTMTYFGREGCTYPQTAVRLNQKKTQSQTECTCTAEALSNLSPTVNINQKDELLEISSGEADILIREEHSPLGEPRLIDVAGAIGGHHCRLVQSNYMTVFENKLRVPLYVSYKVQSQSNSQTVNDCLRYDVRLDPEDSPKCSDYDVEDTNSLPNGLRMYHLIPLSMAGDLDDKFNILITSNIVPMFDGFVTDIWNPVNQRLKEMASGGRDVVVLAGPVFDTNSDGVRDTYKDIAQMSNAWVGETPIPTHYFLVVQRCAQANQDILLACARDDREVVAYIFPHMNGIKTCDGSIDRYMETYQATVKEVERITGLHLLSKLEDGDESEEDLEWLRELKMSREPFRV